MASTLSRLACCWTFCGVLSVMVVSAHEHTRHEYLADRRAGDQGANDSETSTSAASCELAIDIFDDRTKLPLPGLIRITKQSTGKSIRLAQAVERPMGWFSVPPEVKVTVPREELRIEACHGIETELWKATLDLSKTSARDLKIGLRRFYDPSSHNQIAGNTHLHLILDAHDKVGVQLESRAEVDEYLQAASKSDGLDIVYVSYLTRPDKIYITNDYTREDLQQLSDQGVLITNGEEYRHEGGIDPENNRVSYGHVMLLDIPRLILPAGLGTVLGTGPAVSDDTPLHPGIQQARSDGGTVVWCHGLMGTEAVPNWIDGLIDAQNIYDGGNVGSIAEAYYPYLNAGLKIPFSTGTDWGIWDFSRVYVPIEGKVSSQRLLKKLSQGSSFITNGVFLDLTIDGQLPGDTVALRQRGTVKVRARAIGRSDFASMQLVFNGEVIHEVARRPQQGHFVAKMNESIYLAEPGWLALRIPTQRNYHIRSQFTGVSTNIFGKLSLPIRVQSILRSMGRESSNPRRPNN